MILSRRHKFGAKPSFDGVRHWASQAERAYYGELLLREKAGDVRDIECQPVVDLVAGIRFKPDFRFYECGGDHRPGRYVYVDVKGVITEAAALKFRLWKAFGPSVLRIVKRGSKREPWRVVKEIIPV